MYIYIIYKGQFSKQISTASGGTTSECPHLGPSAAGWKCRVPWGLHGRCEGPLGQCRDSPRKILGERTIYHEYTGNFRIYIYMRNFMASVKKILNGTHTVYPYTRNFRGSVLYGYCICSWKPGLSPARSLGVGAEVAGGHLRWHRSRPESGHGDVLDFLDMWAMSKELRLVDKSHSHHIVIT